MKPTSEASRSDYFIWLDVIPESEKQEIAARKQEPNPAASTRGRYVEANAPRAKYYEKNFFECQPALNYGFANPDPTHPWEQDVNAPGPQAVPCGYGTVAREERPRQEGRVATLERDA